ncbi:DUF3261 domain-containing protein [Pelobacter propionicus]|uniref:YjbF family lipoprotein n=1 Tax=Pelobacter propionicus (strain DSM 2379 / NBRC 103807 / OttBd1) TaxID=338966 RepID=A1AMH3_PELPD|nr:DUF3261 domain-containing protein [Pelobacter propionicus]ABK98543.1 hypothetical protein Ppro_0914 [Pelobacter propionicus DSM 2379]
MIRLICLLLALLLMAGCGAQVPFREVPALPLGAAEPARVLDDFKARLPERFQLLNSVVLEYAGLSFMAIGYLDMDRSDNSFQVSCLNPLGVRLFELSGDHGAITARSVLPPLMGYGDLPTAVGTDIGRIFLDLLPAPHAQVWRTGNSISFWQPAGAGRMQYLFAGPDRDLLEKNYYEDSQIQWGVSYYEYVELAGKRYPRGIVLTNYQRNYRLIVRHKELYS